MCLCDSTCVTLMSVKTNFIGTHCSMTCWETAGVQFFWRTMLMYSISLFQKRDTLLNENLWPQYAVNQKPNTIWKVPYGVGFFSSSHLLHTTVNKLMASFATEVKTALLWTCIYQRRQDLGNGERRHSVLHIYSEWSRWIRSHTSDP